MSYAELVQSSQASSICSLASLDKRLTGKGGLDLFLFGRLSLGDAALPTGAGSSSLSTSKLSSSSSRFLTTASRALARAGARAASSSGVGGG